MAKIFGTDGIRGTPGEFPLTDDIVSGVGRAIARIHHQPKVVIGKDTRLSCEKIEKILTDSISLAGGDVVLAGTLPTPGLAVLTRRLKANIGIMISASHNRAQDNGIKFFSNSGYKLSMQEEAKIEELLFGSLDNIKERKSSQATKQGGYAYQNRDGQGLYLNFLKSHAQDLGLKGIKIVLDCAYGACSSVAPLLFQELGAKVYALNERPNGTNINLNCGALYPQTAANFVRKYQADLGFSFDGDGDRVILSAENGTSLDGDYIMAILGLDLMRKNKLPQDTIVTTVMSNYGLQEAIENAGGRLLRTDVGDRNVTEALLKNKLTFGGEQSGHIIFLNRSTTGDGLLTCLEILKVMKETGRRLSELSQCMRKLPQVLINVTVKEKKPLEHLPRVSKAITHSQSKLEGNGRLLVRYSGTEPVVRIMVEGKSKDLIEEIANSLAHQLRKEIGLEE